AKYTLTTLAGAGVDIVERQDTVISLIWDEKGDDMVYSGCMKNGNDNATCEAHLAAFRVDQSNFRTCLNERWHAAILWEVG
ncbi:MAG: hypothetical protein ACREVK_04815, partial [Gammaproteobacteria bacterium]